jgi:hypothetical protein
MQNGIHLLCDRHLHAVTRSEAKSRRRGSDSFCNLAAHPGKDLIQGTATTQFNSYRTVARKFASAGQHKIANS